MPPLVSICVPVLDGEELVGRAVRSALAQDYAEIEVVVVDDASSDGTLRVLREEFGNRIRLFRRAWRSGQAQTTNAAMALARGELIKFLHHDDCLDPDCVSRMVETLERNPSAGMVFSRRRVETRPGEPTDAWEQRYRDVHRGFAGLGELNSGADLFDRLLKNGLHHNWIGEPVCVMVRKRCIERVGGFGLHVRGSIDLGLWMRICAHSDVAFIDRELVTYRHSPASHIKRARAKGEAWLDRLWMVELLCTFPELVADHPQLLELRQRERAMARRTVAAMLVGRQRSPVDLAVWREYEWFRIRSLVSEPQLAGWLTGAANDTVAVNDQSALAVA